MTEVLQRHPQVREAITFGVPDPVWGETVVALVVAAPVLMASDLLTFCSGRLEPRKVPSVIELVGELPRGRSGKVMLEAARELFHQKQADAAPAAFAPDRHADLAARIIGIAADCFKADRAKLTLLSTPGDVPGWDSLAHMELVSALEQEFHIELAARDIMALDRLDKVLALVRP